MNRILLVDTNIMLQIGYGPVFGRVIAEIEEEHEGVCVLPPHTLRMAHRKRNDHGHRDGHQFLWEWINSLYVEWDEDLSVFHAAMKRCMTQPEYGAVPYHEWNSFTQEHPLVKGGQFWYGDKEDLVFILSSIDWAMQIRPEVQITFISSDAGCMDALHQMQNTQLGRYKEAIAQQVPKHVIVEKHERHMARLRKKMNL